MKFLTNEELRQLPLEERYAYARDRWIEGLRNGIPGEIMYWEGMMDGLRTRMAREKGDTTNEKANEGDM